MVPGDMHAQNVNTLTDMQMHSLYLERHVGTLKDVIILAETSTVAFVQNVFNPA